MCLRSWVLGPNLCLLVSIWLRAFAAVRPLRSRYLAPLNGATFIRGIRWGQSSLQGTPTHVDAMAADGTTLSTADNTDPFIPKYTDGTPIQWDGNYAA